jgi:DMSO/TMAO reductase YedYZ molybdopterin-dependent catalytic subunit
MCLNKIAALAFVMTALLPAAAMAQLSAPPPPTIRIVGLVAHPLVLNANEIGTFKQASVTVADAHGARAVYAGVPVALLLARAGAPLGEELRGPKMKVYVAVKAADGYEAVFALAELDPAFTDRVVLLADRRDGQPLSPREGTFRIIVPGEKRPARWVREVTTLDVEEAR